MDGQTCVRKPVGSVPKKDLNALKTFVINVFEAKVCAVYTSKNLLSWLDAHALVAAAVVQLLLQVKQYSSGRRTF